MTLKDLWMLYEADKRILGFSTHTMKAYFLQLNMLIRELGNLEIEAYHTWLKQQRSRTLPKSLTGQAITYSLNQWEKLTAFLADGRLDLDNNRSERSIKPFVIGRKNWLFSHTPRGAKASANIYSVVETAKENGLKPFDYLKFLFEQLPQLTGQLDPKALEPFMPWSASLPTHCRLNS